MIEPKPTVAAMAAMRDRVGAEPADYRRRSDIGSGDGIPVRRPVPHAELVTAVGV